ncbi:hypothetical protein DL766_003832 [Monosporascus sp. MC13-8B]|uniref:Homeobox domain-containing protein n=1 Tax=Monosporascus cannonballus TaxID=155416 RepID=A0ABY0GYL3_9PEZI|nr:hypothetical protein DL762_007912 [Monosporascus cannonballus]RYO90601.1 hypothetical protein DL763_005276 [Monosporascus cannonballus]RYP32744.1 hypothetical protein DL766_003832 [Monosporascus sp. MC13-8B]
MAEHASLTDGKTESKPRLTKDEVDKLEKVFQENPKPSSSVKAQLADSLRLERARINNWFQNRRAKAKQEKKQEAYEARRAAELGRSESASPQECSLSDSTEPFGDNGHHRMQPSSALFPDASSGSQTPSTASKRAHRKDGSVSLADSESPVLRCPEPQQDDSSDTLQPPLPVEFASSGMRSFTRQAQQGFANQESSDDLASSFSALNQNLDPDDQLASHFPGFNSKEKEMTTCQYHNLVEPRFSNPRTASFIEQDTSGVNDMESLGMNNSAQESLRGSDNSGHLQNTPSPSDSFKSPPPPANIASRRKTSRPAALQVPSLKSRPSNLGNGSKTAMDGSRRMDSCQPANIRRIVSTNGNGAGRIQKSNAGPQSPLYFSKSPEALLHLQAVACSPSGSMTTPFAAPPTPNTPAVPEHPVSEPTVHSSCSDDDALVLSAAAMQQNFMAGLNVDLDPSTPPLSPSASFNFLGSTYGPCVNYQQTFVPFYPTELPMREYLDQSDGSLPTTPLYPPMMSGIHRHRRLANHGPANTEFDWETNESVMSSSSSPGHPRSKQIQFTQNITPGNFPDHHDR